MVYAGGFFSITYMQEMTSAICSSATTPAITAIASDTIGDKQGNTAYVPEKTLVDSRDNSTYIVRKLADGNCWMTQDLWLVLDNKKTYSSDDTNVLTSWKPANSTTTGSSYGFNSTTAPYSYYLQNNRFLTNDSTVVANSGQPYEKIGVYYNFYAATAGTMSDQQDICPKGWQLPDLKSTGNRSAYKLFTMYGLADNASSSLKIRRFPFHYLMAGNIYSGSVQHKPTATGSYHTASYGTINNAHHPITFGSSGLNFKDEDKGWAFTDQIVMRCVAKS